jgi:type IV secretory pathway VirB10-like protein
MARVLLALVLLAALYGCGQPNSPAERQEKGAGVEEAAKSQEPVKTVEEPTTPETPPQAPEPEPAPEPQEEEPQSVERKESRSLYQQAVLEETPPYEIDYTASDTGQRYDVFVVTEPTRDKPRLGRILVDLGEKSGADLVTAYFCARPGEAACNDSLFGQGELAQTAQGREFLGVGAGDIPFMRVQF